MDAATVAKAKSRTWKNTAGVPSALSTMPVSGSTTSAPSTPGSTPPSQSSSTTQTFSTSPIHTTSVARLRP